MNLIGTILLSTLIPIPIVIIILFIALKWLYLKKYAKYLDELEIFLKEEPYIDTLTVLRTVDVRLQEQEKTLIEEMTSSPNDQIKLNDIKMDDLNKKKEQFASQTITIEEKIKNLEILKNDLLDRLKNSKVFSCKKIVFEVEEEKNKLNDIKKNVNEESLKFINPIIEFSRKKYEYEKIYKSIDEKITKWLNEINNDDFVKNINDKMQKIQTYLGEAEESVNNFKQDEETFGSFARFKKMLFELLIFDNHYKSLKKYLFDNNDYLKIKKHIDSLKERFDINFDNLNVNTYLKNIEDELMQAKWHFYQLDTHNADLWTRKYLKSLSGLVQVLSQELRAWSFFKTNGLEQIRKYLGLLNNKYNELKAACESVVHIDKMFYWNLKSNLSEIENLNNTILSSILTYSDSMVNKNVSYISKQDHYKKVFLLMCSFVDACNELDKIIDSFYTEGISQGLRYNRLKKIYISGLSDIKKFNIKLTKEDDENIFSIERNKQKIDSYILDNIKYDEKTLKTHVDELFKLIVSFINNVLKKVVILKSFSLINTEYAYKRLVNDIYDDKVLKSEKLIKDGQYMTGLKKLIESIIEVNN
ncbi:MAG: hypothetical protein HDR43_02145 [Mycoplasma sp.]|nr:hypothetical protein [Mycoplasma sp.]